MKTNEPNDRGDAFDEVFGTAIDKAVRRAVDRIGRDPLARLQATTKAERAEQGDTSGTTPAGDTDGTSPARDRVGLRPRTAAEAQWQQHGQAGDLILPNGRLDGVNPYAVLGIARTATWEQVTAAYRRRARAWHPDGAAPEEADRRQELIRQLNMAYTELQARRARSRRSPATDR